ncbi:hypothetical protein GCM10028784_36590 [Myceligenerans cantabricum]
MTHPHIAVAHPVARCTAFAAVVAIGALSMSAPAVASPVSTTHDGLTAAVATPSTELPGTASAVLDAADTDTTLDAGTRKALATATHTLVEAQHLATSSDLKTWKAKRIEAAAAQVRELVVAATTASSEEDPVAAAAAAALAERTTRASRSEERSPLPGEEGEQSGRATTPDGEVSEEQLDEATEALSDLLEKPSEDAVSEVAPGPTKKELAAKAAKVAAARAAKAAAAEAAERRANAQLAARAKRHGNGMIPANLLCDLSFAPGDTLRCDAAAAAEKLNSAFRSAFGRNLTVNDSYRSYADQVAVAAAKGGLAAPPGTSNHGLGQALDLGGGISTFGTAEYRWMAATAGKHGWTHPAWAEPGGSKPEAWHWEYGTRD